MANKTVASLDLFTWFEKLLFFKFFISHIKQKRRQKWIWWELINILVWLKVIIPSQEVTASRIRVPPYLVCFSSFLVSSGPMSRESPSCMSDSLLAMEMAAYLPHTNTFPWHHITSAHLHTDLYTPLIGTGRLRARHRLLPATTSALKRHLTRVWREKVTVLQ